VPVRDTNAEQNRIPDDHTIKHADCDPDQLKHAFAIANYHPDADSKCLQHADGDSDQLKLAFAIPN